MRSPYRFLVLGLAVLLSVGAIACGPAATPPPAGDTPAAAPGAAAPSPAAPASGAVGKVPGPGGVAPTGAGAVPAPGGGTPKRGGKLTITNTEDPPCWDVHCTSFSRLTHHTWKTHNRMLRYDYDGKL